MTTTRAIAILTAVLTMTSTSHASSYLERFEHLEAFLHQGQIGSGRDVWLAKTSLGELDPVALFFGHYDDLGACRDVANMLNTAYPAAGYVCTYAVAIESK